MSDKSKVLEYKDRVGRKVRDEGFIWQLALTNLKAVLCVVCISCRPALPCRYVSLCRAAAVPLTIPPPSAHSADRCRLFAAHYSGSVRRRHGPSGALTSPGRRSDLTRLGLVCCRSGRGAAQRPDPSRAGLLSER